MRGLTAQVSAVLFPSHGYLLVYCLLLFYLYSMNAYGVGEEGRNT